MKERMLVMNGSRLIQTDSAGEWVTQKVEKANGVKPGVYNLYSAQIADKSKNYTGYIIHSDTTLVYQQVGKTIITHKTSDFGKKTPEVGKIISIDYNEQGAALTSNADSMSLKKGLKI